MIIFSLSTHNSGFEKMALSLCIAGSSTDCTTTFPLTLLVTPYVQEVPLHLLRLAFLLTSYKPLVVGLLKPFKFIFIITLSYSWHSSVLVFLPEIDSVCFHHTPTFFHSFLVFLLSYFLLPFPLFSILAFLWYTYQITYIFAGPATDFRAVPWTT